MSKSPKAIVERMKLVAQARQRLLERAEFWNQSLAGAVELVLEGIRIGEIPDVVVCPKGYGAKEIRLSAHLEAVMKLGERHG